MKLRPPQDCATMSDLRVEIDALDAALVEMLAVRSGYIDRAVELKRIEDLPARIDARVEDVVAKVRGSAAARGLDPALAERLWRELIEWSIAREARTLGD